MSERYARVYSLPNNLYLDGAPVLIAAGALLKDNNENGKILAQLKLQNLAEPRLIACKVAIRAFDTAGAELPGIESYSYLDILISRGENFGAKVPIALPDSTTRKMIVSVIQAVFDNGEVWHDSVGVWTPIAPHQRIENIEIQEQYSIEVGGNCEYIPWKTGCLFGCTCGTINLSEYTACSGCRRETARLLSAFNIAELTRKRALRLQQEREREEERKRIASERAAAEKRIEAEREAEKKCVAEIKAKKAKRTYIIVAISFAAVITIATTYNILTKKIIPANRYKQAEALLAAGDYYGALALFETLGEYSDAKERIFALWSGEPSISAGGAHMVGLKSDGTVVATGSNAFGEIEVGGWSDIVSVSANSRYTVGWKSDGTVVATGNNDYGQCDVSGWTGMKVPKGKK